MIELLDPAQYAFSYHAIPPFIAGTLLIVLGISVLFRDRGSYPSWIFAVLMLFGAVWLYSYSGMYCVKSENLAYVIILIENSAVVFIPTFLYLFAVSVLKQYQRAKYLLLTGFSMSVFLLISVYTSHYFVEGVYRYPWGFYPRYGFLGFCFMAMFFWMLMNTVRLYWEEYVRSRFGRRRWQMKRLFIGFGITVFGAVDYLAAFGVPVYPMGYLSVFIFIIILAQTIWRYRLQDISPAFAVSHILETMDDALIILDGEGLVRSANRAACALLEKKEKEILRLPLWTVNEQILPRDQFEQVIETRNAQNYHTVLYFHSGRRVVADVTTSIVPGRHKDNIALVLIAKDVSGQKKTEAALERKNIFILLLQNIAVAANKAKSVEELMRYALDEICRQMKWPLGHIFVRALHDPDVVISSRIWYMSDPKRYYIFKSLTEAAVFEKGSGAAGVVFASETPLWIQDIERESHFLRKRICAEMGFRSYFAFPVMLENEVEAILEFFSENTIEADESLFEAMINISSQIARVFERKRAESKLKIAYDELEDRVERRTLELREANQKLRKMDETKSQFMLAASHELRTPLTAIKGYLLLILQNKVGEVSPNQREFLGHMRNAADRLEHLVNDLLSLTKLEMEADTLKIEPVNVREMLNEETGIFKAHAEQKKIEFKVELAEDLGFIEADENKIREIIENLVSNAFKYTPAHGRVTVKASRTDQEICIVVTDTGIGIKAEVLDRIFEPFFHAHKQSVWGDQSIGLGLALTKKIIDMHGGDIKVISREGSGTTFTVMLPVPMSEPSSD